jgi:hypothetical protein
MCAPCRCVSKTNEYMDKQGSLKSRREAIRSSLCSVVQSTPSKRVLRYLLPSFIPSASVILTGFCIINGVLVNWQGPFSVTEWR